jgi:choline dehydrogenase-like flavoprotein
LETTLTADVVIIGSGPGGATLAWALRESGASVLILERGQQVPLEAQNSSARAVFLDRRYKSDEVWVDGEGRDFKPGINYAVGGNTKYFGGALQRLKAADLEATEHEDGISPAWPLDYAELEPWYQRAEELYRAHGSTGENPFDSPRSEPYPRPPIRHEPIVQGLVDSLREQGLHPYSIPMGVDVEGDCVLCATCDGFPCRLLAKSDAESCCIAPALEHPTVRLQTGVHVDRLITDGPGGRVVAAEATSRRRRLRISGGTFIVAAGAVNTAALLLRSAGRNHERGLANGSDQVGRNYMTHVNSALMALHPLRRNPVTFQKTMALDDFYFGTDEWPYPMGQLQLIGKVQGPMVQANVPHLPAAVASTLAARSLDFWALSEDLPRPESRVTLTGDGRIRRDWRKTNAESHERLVASVRRALRAAGYPIFLRRHFGSEVTSHQCGTVRFGDDPDSSVLDRDCKAHELENLYAVDSSFFPSSAATGPTLTIVANALRTAEHLQRRLTAAR